MGACATAAGSCQPATADERGVTIPCAAGNAPPLERTSGRRWTPDRTRADRWVSESGVTAVAEADQHTGAAETRDERSPERGSSDR